ncbi:hypothetical protein D3C72_1123800 [compost metagenome]
MGVDAVKHLRTVERLVEAEMQERLHRIARLRRALADGMLDAAGDRVRRASAVGGLVAEEADDIAQRGQADTHHLRVLRHVDQFIEILRIEPAAQADTGRIGGARERVGAIAPGEFPVAGRNRDAGVVLVDAPGQRVARLGVVEAGRCVRHHRAVEHAAGQRHRRGCRGRHQLGAIRARDGSPVGILRHRNGDGQARRIRLRHIALPGRIEEHVAAFKVDRIAGRRARVRHGQDVATVRRVVAQHAAGLAHVLGLEHDEIGRVLDHAIGIDRRQRQVLDDRVLGILGIDLAGDGARHLLILAHAAVAAGEVLRTGDLQCQCGRARLRRRAATT